MSGAIVRAARPEDVPHVWALVLAFADHTRMRERATGDAARLAADLFADAPRVECLLVEDAGEIVAYALVYPRYSSFRTRALLWLEDLFVAPEARGRGHGRRLLAAVAALAVERALLWVDWEVLEWNAEALAFYRAAGARALAPESRVLRLEGDALRALAAPAR